jgi:hypothetical protein
MELSHNVSCINLVYNYSDIPKRKSKLQFPNANMLLSLSEKFYHWFSFEELLLSMLSRHPLPNRILTYTITVIITKEMPDMVENQPTPILSIAGRTRAVPAAPNR